MSKNQLYFFATIGFLLAVIGMLVKIEYLNTFLIFIGAYLFGGANYGLNYQK